MNEKPVSVVIVTYNASKYIISSIKSILNSKNIHIDKIVVVDNDSSDGTTYIIKRHFGADPRIKIIKLKKNYGFPLAVNIGVASTKTDLVAIMNPDVIIDPYCLSALAFYINNNPYVVVAQPKILHPGGFIDSAGGVMDILGHGFHIGKYEKEKDYSLAHKARDILFAEFACAMVKRDVYLKLGGLDSRYFLYNEDLDFCWRCWLAGYKVAYVPNALAYHIGQHSTRKVPYHALYFGRRNRLYTIFMNYPLTVSIISSLLLMGLYIMLGVKSALIDAYEARLTFRIIIRFFKDLRYLISKRMTILRRVSLLELFRRDLITFRLVGLRLHMRGFYRIQLRIKRGRGKA